MEQPIDNEIENMINVSENNPEDNIVVEPGPAESPEVETAPVSQEDVAQTEQEPEENTPEIVDPISVSDVIYQNADKCIKMIMLKDCVQTAAPLADLVNYIVFVSTEKNIPCVYDCQKLVVPTASVKKADGTWNVTSVEGRRSGFVIKCPKRDLVMSKNFVYDIEFDDNGKIMSVVEYNRKHEVTLVTYQSTDDYDTAAFIVTTVLPKIVKCGKYTTIEQLREQVINSYNTVDDINALFKIVDLRIKIGC